MRFLEWLFIDVFKTGPNTFNDDAILVVVESLKKIKKSVQFN